MSLYVYYDDNFGTSWIKRSTAKAIVKYLQNYGFKAIDAKELRNVMSKATRRGYSIDEVVIVFSLDAAPNTVIDNPSTPSASSLIRQFLNAGNTVIWMGDIPLYHISLPEGQMVEPGTKAQQAVLGLHPNVQMLPPPGRPARPTYYSILFGLPTWSGMRPTQSPPSSPPFVIPLTQNPSSLPLHGYIATYHSGHLSGFIRIYDFELKKLTEPLLKGLVGIALRNPLKLLKKDMEKLSQKLENLSQLVETRFSALKSEFDSLGPKLDEILHVLKERMTE